ncbi:MAG: hypothetical protein P3C10_10405 [Gemmatimonadota bacterium]|nr:hypothetical protein [Gemmatimonadota bacterium]
MNGYFVKLRDGASDGTDELAHTETLVLIDQDARTRGMNDATLALDMEQITREVATLERAGQSRAARMHCAADS